MSTVSAQALNIPGLASAFSSGDERYRIGRRDVVGRRIAALLLLSLGQPIESHQLRPGYHPSEAASYPDRLVQGRCSYFILMAHPIITLGKAVRRGMLVRSECKRCGNVRLYKASDLMMGFGGGRDPMR